MIIIVEIRPMEFPKPAEWNAVYLAACFGLQLHNLFKNRFIKRTNSV